MTIIPNEPETLATNSRVLSRSFSALYSANTGTKALENAPSAKRRRRKLGIRLANKKTSETAPAPSTPATIISRTKPKIRDTNVNALTNTPDFNNFLLIEFSV